MERLERFEQSGSNVQKLCDAEGVSTASFYQWRRKLQPSTTLDNASANQFVPVILQRTETRRSTTLMSIDLPGGIRVRFELPDIDRDQP
jgi:transposase-like protein